MAWVRLDDGFFRNSKSIAAGKDGRALYLAALCFSAATLTDGVISEEALPILLADAGVQRGTVQVLVKVGMWEPVEGGYRIPDYLELNPCSEKVKADRHAAKVRMRRSRGENAAQVEAAPVEPALSLNLVPTLVADESDARLRDVWGTIARAKLQQQRQAGRRVARETHWLATVASNECLARVDEARRLVDTYPEIDLQRLAVAVMGDTTVLRYLRRAG